MGSLREKREAREAQDHARNLVLVGTIEKAMGWRGIEGKGVKA